MSTPIPQYKYYYTIINIPQPADMADYLERIRSLCRAVHLCPAAELPEDMSHLTFESANAIERALLEVEEAIGALEEGRLYPGEFQTGGI